MPLIVRPRGPIELPVEGDLFRPDRLRELSVGDVHRLPIQVGNARVELGDVFEIEGDGADAEIVLEGDYHNVHAIASGMSDGMLTIRGIVGSHLGAGMTGGTISLDGSAGAWLGCTLRGGLIHVRGDVGDSLGAASPGDKVGMREGVILVEGSVGRDAGLGMRRGLIAVQGSAGDGAGRGMIAGSIVVFGPVGRWPGAGMKRGSIVLFPDEKTPPALLPTFRRAARQRPPFVTIYLSRLVAWGFPVPEFAFQGAFERYNGDLVENGQGEVLIWGRDR